VLIGNISVAETVNEEKVDKYVRFALKLGDLKITIDLCKHNNR
jgi:hypothetical protein